MNGVGKTPEEILAAYIPMDAVEHVSGLIRHHGIQLIITGRRASRLGDFRPASGKNPHRIKVNGTLNVYEFLLVFLHELAHLIVYEQYGRKVLPHGREWKTTYGALVRHAVGQKLFHPSISDLLMDYSYKVKASGVAGLEVAKVLRNFDRQENATWHFLDEIDENTIFQTESGRLFRKEEKIKTRYRCLCLATRRRYLVHQSAKVISHPEHIQTMQNESSKQ